jgi:hypothetical protein
LTNGVVHPLFTYAVHAGDVTSAKGSRRNLAWPERWPVVAPLIGVGFTLSAAAVVGGADGDWMDATLLAALAAVFGAIAARNSRDQ